MNEPGAHNGARFNARAVATQTSPHDRPATMHAFDQARVKEGSLPIRSPDPVRVFIADDHALFRDGLKLLFASRSGFQVIGEAADLEALREHVRATQADLLLVDYHMPGGDTSALVNHLKHTAPQLRIVVLTGSSSGTILKQLAAVQADGILLKNGSADEFMAHLHAVLRGERVIPPEVAHLISQGDALLTRREMQIVKLICDGLSNTAMGESLSLSPKTVDKHRENLMRKLQVSSVAQLVRKAQEFGWLA